MVDWLYSQFHPLKSKTLGTSLKEEWIKQLLRFTIKIYYISLTIIIIHYTPTQITWFSGILGLCSSLIISSSELLVKYRRLPILVMKYRCRSRQPVIPRIFCPRIVGSYPTAAWSWWNTCAKTHDPFLLRECRVITLIQDAKQHVHDVQL